MIKRLILVLVAVAMPFLLGLLFTYDVIKIDWVSFMEIQPSFRPQEDPLPLPNGSIPVDGAYYVEGLDAPVNPVPADEVSLQRGQQLYEIACTPCHGAQGNGQGTFSAFLTKVKPTNLLDDRVRNLSDGSIFMTITHGVPGTMPPMRENLPTARDRWDVVNYVRQLQGAQ
jgi:mono/diheme cytochrome c family protein